MTPETLIIATYILIFLFVSFLIFNHLSDKQKTLKPNRRTTIADEFKGQKVLIDGDLCKDNKHEITEQLKAWNVEVEPKMSTETGILITGKNADELVIEEAKTFGTKIYSEESFMALNKAPHYVLNKNARPSKKRSTVKVKN
ncbi:hypothetical protein [Zunongwangia pacifica]|uniref:BRCT domain-containing protein n=1 Tax=Zunongwangia pacifica TaxID=2911062 RepID=A0A9X2CR30_9FLAO|nr:hypothetical protein [Zunongwangia pacifica]MCL6220803.1 hypothetical protein [Zunongwangia pacifica]